MLQLALLSHHPSLFLMRSFNFPILLQNATRESLLQVDYADDAITRSIPASVPAVVPACETPNSAHLNIPTPAVIGQGSQPVKGQFALSSGAQVRSNIVPTKGFFKKLAEKKAAEAAKPVEATTTAIAEKLVPRSEPTPGSLPAIQQARSNIVPASGLMNRIKTKQESALVAQVVQPETALPSTKSASPVDETKKEDKVISATSRTPIKVSKTLGGCPPLPPSAKPSAIGNGSVPVLSKIAATPPGNVKAQSNIVPASGLLNRIKAKGLVAETAQPIAALKAKQALESVPPIEPAEERKLPLPSETKEEGHHSIEMKAEELFTDEKEVTEAPDAAKVAAAAAKQATVDIGPTSTAAEAQAVDNAGADKVNEALPLGSTKGAPEPAQLVEEAAFAPVATAPSSAAASVTSDSEGPVLDAAPIVPAILVEKSDGKILEEAAAPVPQQILALGKTLVASGIMEPPRLNTVAAEEEIEEDIATLAGEAAGKSTEVLSICSTDIPVTPVKEASDDAALPPASTWTDDSAASSAISTDESLNVNAPSACLNVTTRARRSLYADLTIEIPPTPELPLSTAFGSPVPAGPRPRLVDLLPDDSPQRGANITYTVAHHSLALRNIINVHPKLDLDGFSKPRPATLIIPSPEKSEISQGHDDGDIIRDAAGDIEMMDSGVSAPLRRVECARSVQLAVVDPRLDAGNLGAGQPDALLAKEVIIAADVSNYELVTLPGVVLDCKEVQSPLLVNTSDIAIAGGTSAALPRPPAMTKQHLAGPFGSPIKLPRKKKVDGMNYQSSKYPICLFSRASAGKEALDEERQCQCASCAKELTVPSPEVLLLSEPERMLHLEHDEEHQVGRRRVHAQLDAENGRDAIEAQALSSWVKMKELASSAVPSKPTPRVARLCPFSHLAHSLGDPCQEDIYPHKRIFFKYLEEQAELVTPSVLAYVGAIELADRASEGLLGTDTRCKAVGLGIAMRCCDGMAGERAAQLAEVAAREAMKDFERPGRAPRQLDWTAGRTVEADIQFIRGFEFEIDIDVAPVSGNWHRWMPGAVAAGPEKGTTSQRVWCVPALPPPTKGEIVTGALVDAAEKLKSCVGGTLRRWGVWK